MLTGAHGVRMQYDYTHDTAGSPAAVAPTSPRWLRLTRSGNDAHGLRLDRRRHWTQIGAAHLAGLPGQRPGGTVRHLSPDRLGAAVRVGGAGSGGSATGLTGNLRPRQPPRPVARRRLERVRDVGANPEMPTLSCGRRITARAAPSPLTGSGDIAPAVGLPAAVHRSAQPHRRVRRPDRAGRPRRPVHHRRIPPRPDPHHVDRKPAPRTRARRQDDHHRRASPSSPALAAAAVAIPLGAHLLRANGNYVYPAARSPSCA